MLRQGWRPLSHHLKNLKGNNLSFLISGMSSEHYKVIIVGAGVSGLSAANTLIRRGVTDLLVLEAHNRTGGRVFTVDDGHGGIFEKGAQWLHGDVNNPLYPILSKARLIEYRGEALESCVESVEDEGYRFYNSQGSEIDHETVLLANQIHQHIDEAVEESYAIGMDIELLKQEAFEGGYRKFVTVPSLNLREAIVSIVKLNELLSGIVDGIDSYDRSSLITDHYFDDCGGRNFCFPRGITPFIQLLSSKLDDKICLNSPVTRIDWQNEQNKVTITTKDRNYTADACIVTCSLGVLQQRPKLFTPSLPDRKLEALDGLNFGNVEKFGMIFDERWWKEITGYFFVDTGLTDEFIEKISEITGDQDLWWREITGVFSNTNNPNCLSVWLSGQSAITSSQYEDSVIVDVIRQLLLLYTGIKMNQPRHVIRSNWSTDEYFCGAYSSLTATYDPKYAAEMSQPLVHNNKPVVWFSGEAYHHCHMSTIHGAYQHGQSQAEKLVNSMEI